MDFVVGVVGHGMQKLDLLLVLVLMTCGKLILLMMLVVMACRKRILLVMLVVACRKSVFDAIHGYGKQKMDFVGDVVGMYKMDLLVVFVSMACRKSILLMVLVEMTYRKLILSMVVMAQGKRI